MERGISEGGLAVAANGAPEMIGVGVGVDDLGDGARFCACGFQAVGQFARSGGHGATAACVNQNDVAAGFEQQGADLKLRLVALHLRAEQSGEFFRFCFRAYD
jgi:hypothetical protein